ncbi:SGNH/GDSL hydrolase family protein [Aeromicrobium yanjiei]|uniref:SGNH/GDSL hydrolase family protein n=1 Tax=Aeromicrobium yanjiei TaxID=2662028 RepID=UPI001890766E|nr:SGNH/GDSL hydrolase family protein [Aeromicrobium yanjiei]
MPIGRPPQASSAAKSRGDLVVIGDSISDAAFFKTLGGKPDQMWWAKLGRKTRTTPRVYAERGSGYTRPGKCVTTTIGQRIGRKAMATRMNKAKIVVIAAGVNDYRKCVFRADGTYYLAPTSGEEVEEAISAAFDELDAAVTYEAKVIITAPYGSRPELKQYRERLVRSLRAHSEEHGFQYVDTAHGTLWGKSKSRDRIHPTAKGMQRLYRDIYMKSNLRKRFR